VPRRQVLASRDAVPLHCHDESKFKTDQLMHLYREGDKNWPREARYLVGVISIIITIMSPLA